MAYSVFQARGVVLEITALQLIVIFSPSSTSPFLLFFFLLLKLGKASSFIFSLEKATNGKSSSWNFRTKFQFNLIFGAKFIYLFFYFWLKVGSKPVFASFHKQFSIKNFFVIEKLTKFWIYKNWTTFWCFLPILILMKSVSGIGYLRHQLEY